MNTNVEKIGENKAKITVTIDYNDFCKEEDKVFNKQKSKLSVPGFRKGKVTKQMAHKVYGKNAFLEDTMNECINSTYYDAIKDCGVKVISDPKIEVESVDLEKEIPFVYTATVAIIPEFTLADYKGVELKKTKVEVTEEDINNAIKAEQEKSARVVVAGDRASKDGDILNIDFDGYMDGKEFDGGCGRSYMLTLGSHTFIDNFEDQLIGKKVGETVEVNVTFPANYGHKDYANKKALFKVVINEIKEKELPEVNDEFISEISEFDTLDKYKEDLKQKLAKAKEKQAKEDDKDKLLQKIAEATTINLADEAIDQGVNDIIKDNERRFKSHGWDFNTYLTANGKTMEDFLKEERPVAERSLKNSIILDKIAKDEKIVASDEMVEEEIERVAASYGMDKEKFRKNYVKEDGLQKLRDELLYPAVLEFIYNNAKLS